MTYLSVAAMANDADLLARVTACAAMEGDRDPELWMQQHKWHIAAQPGWGDAWDSALANAHPNPGADPAVITDLQILSGVQAINQIRPRP